MKLWTVRYLVLVDMKGMLTAARPASAVSGAEHPWRLFSSERGPILTRLCPLKAVHLLRKKQIFTEICAKGCFQSKYKGPPWASRNTTVTMNSVRRVSVIKYLTSCKHVLNSAHTSTVPHIRRRKLLRQKWTGNLVAPPDAIGVPSQLAHWSFQCRHWELLISPRH